MASAALESLPLKNAVWDASIEYAKKLEMAKDQLDAAIIEKDREIEHTKVAAAERIAEQQKGVETAMKSIHAFRDAVADLLGATLQGDVVVPPTTQVDIDDIVKRVLQKIPIGANQTYEVAPFEALKLDWQRDAVEKMNAVIDSLSEIEIKVLAYMIMIGKLETQSEIALVLLGNKNSTSRGIISKAVNALHGLNLARITKNGSNATIEEFVKIYLQYAADDLTPFVKRVIEHVRQRRNGK